MSNYPDGTWECDPRAPWNRQEPWETKACGSCKWLAPALVRGERVTVCTDPESQIIEETSPSCSACPNWEPER